MSALNGITMPKSYLCQAVETIELHLFGNSSQDACSVVAFLRGKFIFDHGVMMHVLFVFGKTRVAPTKVLRGEQQRTFVAT